MLSLSLSFLLLSALLSVSAEPALSLQVSGEQEVRGVQNLKVTTTLTNIGDLQLKLFNDPRTTLSDVPMKTFHITNDNGTSPEFTGVMSKYVRKVVIANDYPESYTLLDPGESIETIHDLSETYDFDAAGPGQYTLQPRTKFHYLDPETNTPVAIIATTDTDLVHRALITGDLVVKRRSLRTTNSRIVRREQFKGCSAEQQGQIGEAAAAAKKYAEEALAYVGKKTQSERIQTWFGAHDQNRFNKLSQILRNMNDNDFASFDYDCTCDKADLFAFVYPEDWGTVHLCGAFWSAPLTGANSKGGTIFHEATHFKENAGTDDFSYGQDECKLLAKRSPDEAILNADSYEFFVENQPALK